MKYEDMNDQLVLKQMIKEISVNCFLIKLNYLIFQYHVIVKMANTGPGKGLLKTSIRLDLILKSYSLFYLRSQKV